MFVKIGDQYYNPDYIQRVKAGSSGKCYIFIQGVPIDVELPIEEVMTLIAPRQMTAPPEPKVESKKTLPNWPEVEVQGGGTKSGSVS